MKVFPFETLSPREWEQVRSIRDVLPEGRYLVGGLVRDALLGLPRSKLDVDLVSPRAWEDVNLLRERLGGVVVVLDEGMGLYRLVLGKDRTVDVAQMQGALTQDLRRRDFTLNAIAVDLHSGEVVDPLNGLGALTTRTLEVCSPRSFELDPLRVLRAFSIPAQCGLRWGRSVVRALSSEEVRRLVWVKAERINQELLRLFSSSRCFNWWRAMYLKGISPLLIPELNSMAGVEQGPYHHLDVLEHSMLALRRMEDLLSRLRRIGRIRDKNGLREYLEEKIGSWSRYALLKWAEFFHDIGKPAVQRRVEDGRIVFYRHEIVGARLIEDVMERLRFSRRQIKLVSTVVAMHMRPGDLTKEGVTEKALYRFFRQSQGEALGILLVSWADAWATRGELNPWKNFYYHRKRIIEMINLYGDWVRKTSLPKLVDGHDVMRIKAIGPGPVVGQILREIRELQELGQIRTREEALEYITNWKSER